MKNRIVTTIVFFIILMTGCKDLIGKRENKEKDIEPCPYFVGSILPPDLIEVKIKNMDFETYEFVFFYQNQAYWSSKKGYLFQFIDYIDITLDKVCDEKGICDSIVIRSKLLDSILAIYRSKLSEEKSSLIFYKRISLDNNDPKIKESFCGKPIKPYEYEYSLD